MAERLKKLKKMRKLVVRAIQKLDQRITAATMQTKRKAC